MRKIFNKTHIFSQRNAWMSFCYSILIPDCYPWLESERQHRARLKTFWRALSWQKKNSQNKYQNIKIILLSLYHDESLKMTQLLAIMVAAATTLVRLRREIVVRWLSKIFPSKLNKCRQDGSAWLAFVMKSLSQNENKPPECEDRSVTQPISDSIINDGT